MSHVAQPSGVAADSTIPPAKGLFRADAAVTPITAGALFSLAAPPHWQQMVIRLTVIWSAAILCFLGGVRAATVSIRQERAPARN